MTAKTISLRLPADAYDQATRLAKARKQSLNRLFQEGLVLLEEHERERLLFDDFSRIVEAGDEETDVEFAFEAQVEAAPDR